MIGGWGETPPEQALASVLALAADCSEWSTIAPTGLARCNAVTTVLPEGKVLVAGGQSALHGAARHGSMYK